VNPLSFEPSQFGLGECKHSTMPCMLLLGLLFFVDFLWRMLIRFLAELIVRPRESLHCSQVLILYP
jgi:hypothetical protein